MNHIICSEKLCQNIYALSETYIDRIRTLVCSWSIRVTIRQFNQQNLLDIYVYMYLCIYMCVYVYIFMLLWQCLPDPRSILLFTKLTPQKIKECFYFPVRHKPDPSSPGAKQQREKKTVYQIYWMYIKQISHSINWLSVSSYSTLYHGFCCSRVLTSVTG